MGTKLKKDLQYYMRVLHRNLGFLAVGLAIVYSLSGIALLYRDTDNLKITTTVEKTIEPNLSAENLGEALRMRGFEVKEEKDGIIYFNNNGQYEVQTGKATFDTKKLMFPFDKFVGIHKVASTHSNNMHWLLLAFGLIMFFLAVSSLFMFKTNTKQFKTGMVYTVVGIVLTAILFVVLG